MTPCQKLYIQEGTAGRVECMQQSSAAFKNQDVGIGLRKIVACTQPCLRCRLVSTVFGTVSSLHPTSFLMILVLNFFNVQSCRYMLLSHTYHSGTSMLYHACTYLHAEIEVAPRYRDVHVHAYNSGSLYVRTYA